MHIFTFYKKRFQTRVTDCDLTIKKILGFSAHLCKIKLKNVLKKKVDRVRFLAYYVHNIHLSTTLIATKIFVSFRGFSGILFLANFFQDYINTKLY